MHLSIFNTQPLIPAEPLLAGAAIKVMLAGGTKITLDQARRGSGLSKFLWLKHQDEILEMVKALEE